MYFTIIPTYIFENSHTLSGELLMSSPPLLKEGENILIDSVSSPPRNILPFNLVLLFFNIWLFLPFTIVNFYPLPSTLQFLQFFKLICIHKIIVINYFPYLPSLCFFTC